mgnify:FL=1|jgi:hypothetical protein
MAISLDMRSDNWLRSQISKLEKRNRNIGDSLAMSGMMGGMTGAASSMLAGGVFDKKIKKYQALLDSRTAANAAKPPSAPQPPAENPWAENTSSQDSTNLAGNTFSLYEGAQQVSENQQQSMMPQMYNKPAIFSPETNQAAVGMFGQQQSQPSFDRTLPPTPGVADPDSMGINSLYNTN